jgi:hypothetical protein
VEWIWGVILMTNEDKEDCLTILKDIKDMCIKCDYHDAKTAELIHDIDMSVRAVIEIIENKPIQIERMF